MENKRILFNIGKNEFDKVFFFFNTYIIYILYNTGMSLETLVGVVSMCGDRRGHPWPVGDLDGVGLLLGDERGGSLLSREGVHGLLEGSLLAKGALRL